MDGLVGRETTWFVLGENVRSLVVIVGGGGVGGLVGGGRLAGLVGERNKEVDGLVCSLNGCIVCELNWCELGISLIG